jgi:hypothetical protein
MQNASALIPLSAMARRLHVPVKWLREEAEAGNIPHLNAAGHLLFDYQTIEQILLDRARSGGRKLAHAA